MTDFESHQSCSQTPGVLEVLDGIPATRLKLDGDDVEPVLVAGAPMPNLPKRCDLAQDPPLLPADALHRRSAEHRSARLHFHEGHQRPPARHHIHIMMPQAEAMTLDLPAAAGQERHGDPLPPETTPLTSVFPLRARREPSGGSHGARYSQRAERATPFL